MIPVIDWSRFAAEPDAVAAELGRARNRWPDIPGFAVTGAASLRARLAATYAEAPTTASQGGAT